MAKDNVHTNISIEKNQQHLDETRTSIVEKLQRILRQEATARGISTSFSGVRRRSDYLKVRFEGELVELEHLFTRLADVLPTLYVETLSRVEYDNVVLHTMIVTEPPQHQDIYPDDRRRSLQNVFYNHLFTQPVSLKTRDPIVTSSGEMLTNTGEIIYDESRLRHPMPHANTNSVHVLIIDNYDVLTYSLAQHLGNLGAKLTIWRNDAFSLSDIASLKPEGIVISSGSGTPDEAGHSVDVVKHFASSIPILGVGLGHLSIGAAFGAHIVPAKKNVNDIVKLSHDGSGIFERMPSDISAARHHTLVLDDLPSSLIKNAWVDDIFDGSKVEIIMGIQHVEYPVWGVHFQFNSTLTDEEQAMLLNFLSIC